MRERTVSQVHFQNALMRSLEREKQLCREIGCLPKGCVRERPGNEGPNYGLEYWDNNCRKYCAIPKDAAEDFRRRIQTRKERITEAKATMHDIQSVLRVFQSRKWDVPSEAVEIAARRASFYDNMPCSIDPLFAPNDEWLKEMPPIVMSAEPYRPDMLKHKTLDGILVRSKNEVTVSNEIFHLNIKYRYELPLLLDGTIKRPDFTLCHPYTNLPFILEIGGMMDRYDYRKNFIEKLVLYDKYGFRLGDRLLVLLCNSDEVVDLSLLHQMLDDRHFFG